jgi:omega-amidase
MLFVKPGGEVTHYDKRHLFAYGGEHERYSAGNRRVTVDYLGWRINLQVCYDLRFPAWCRLRDDFDLQLFVANWPTKRVAHWSALLRARAIENQCYVVAVNRAGRDGKGAGDGEKTLCVEIELDKVGEVRGAFPFQGDADRYELLD